MARKKTTMSPRTAIFLALLLALGLEIEFWEEGGILGRVLVIVVPIVLLIGASALHSHNEAKKVAAAEIAPRMALLNGYRLGGRQHIPETVRLAVWSRDGGRCSECGSSFDIQYDHIIPVSRGGATSVENLQVLCRRCNRRKSARI